MESKLSSEHKQQKILLFYHYLFILLKQSLRNGEDFEKFFKTRKGNQFPCINMKPISKLSGSWSAQEHPQGRDSCGSNLNFLLQKLFELP